jgi:hypothetical protein
MAASNGNHRLSGPADPEHRCSPERSYASSSRRFVELDQDSLLRRLDNAAPASVTPRVSPSVPPRVSPSVPPRVSDKGEKRPPARRTSSRTVPQWQLLLCSMGAIAMLNGSYCCAQWELLLCSMGAIAVLNGSYCYAQWELLLCSVGAIAMC